MRQQGICVVQRPAAASGWGREQRQAQAHQCDHLALSKITDEIHSWTVGHRVERPFEKAERHRSRSAKQGSG